jgi:rfaE bifunctional protein kinase chain/domain
MNKKKIFISGNFNILHPGHLRLFRFAKKLGNKLFVGIFSDKVAGVDAYIKENLRYEALLAHKMIDEVFLIKKDISYYIKKIKPNFIVKGKEHENEFNIEKQCLEKLGGKLIFSSGEIVFSSKNLFRKETDILKKKDDINSNFNKRHKITKKKIHSIISDFNKVKALVIGDTIIDEYIFCESLGLSQEDNSIIYKSDHRKKFIGGAGIVASHLSSLGSNVELLTVLGNDQNKKFILDKLKNYKIDNSIIIDNSRSTNLKVRYKFKNNTVFRLSELSNFEINKKIQNRIFSKVKKLIDNKKINLIIFSDFNYGVLTSDLIIKITRYAKKKNICLTADSQISSQIGDITKYKDVNLLSSTEFEARTSLKNAKDGLVVLSEQLRLVTSNLNIILKLQEDGVFIHATNKDKNIISEYENDKIFAINKSPLDTAGAGDSLLVATSLSLALGNDIWISTLMGNFAAAIQVSRYGNLPITTDEFRKIVDNLL